MTPHPNSGELEQQQKPVALYLACREIQSLTALLSYRHYAMNEPSLYRGGGLVNGQLVLFVITVAVKDFWRGQKYSNHYEIKADSPSN